jgi:hypothetical protein
MSKEKQCQRQPKKVCYPKRFTKSRDKLSVFHYPRNNVLVSSTREFSKNPIIKAHLSKDSKLKIILNSILAKDKYDAPWFLSNIMAEAHQIFNSDSISDKIHQINSRIGALEDINHELIGMGYNALKDFKFVSSVYSMINSESCTIRNVNQNAGYEVDALMEQQKKDIAYANEFKARRSWPRIFTYVTTIAGSLGVTMAAFASQLRQAVENMAGANKFALIAGSGAAVLSVVAFSTGKLLDFFVNREIKIIIRNTDERIKEILRWRDGEVNKRLAFIRFKVIELEAKCRYLNDVKKEVPNLAVAIDQGNWEQINRWVDSSINKVLSDKKEKTRFRFLDRVSSGMVERANAEISGLDGNPTPQTRRDKGSKKK